MWLVVGLGNPGSKYERNRHNVGFMAVDAISNDPASFPPFKAKFQGKLSEGRIGSTKILLLKPETYMNNSGQSVAAAANFYKIEADHIIVLHDELDLKPGEVRVKKGGGNAGHNGLKSMQAHLGTPDFWRMRIGIGHPGEKDMVSNYVLSDFAKADQTWLDVLLQGVDKYAAKLTDDGPESFVKAVSDYMRPLE